MLIIMMIINLNLYQIKLKNISKAVLISSREDPFFSIAIALSIFSKDTSPVTVSCVSVCRWDFSLFKGRFAANGEALPKVCTARRSRSTFLRRRFCTHATYKKIILSSTNARIIKSVGASPSQVAQNPWSFI